MATYPVILIGGGGHASVVLDACLAAGVHVAGVLDDDPGCQLATAVAYLGLTDTPTPRECRVIVTVGDLNARQQIIETLEADAIADAVVHPSAVVSGSSQLGRGVVVLPTAVVNNGAVIGKHAIINTRAVVEHGCMVGTNTHLAPGSVLGGGAGVGDHTLIGLQAGVLPGVQIGSRCIIGAGAIVTGDIYDGERAVGVPARLLSRAN